LQYEQIKAQKNSRRRPTLKWWLWVGVKAFLWFWEINEKNQTDRMSKSAGWFYIEQV
jgi:hypothetical protein